MKSYIISERKYRMRINNNNYAFTQNKVCRFNDLLELFPFGRTKLLRLCQDGTLPVIKVGKSYITNQELLDRWFIENEGHELR